MGGGILAMALVAMSVLVLLDCWVRLPLLSRANPSGPEAREASR